MAGESRNPIRGKSRPVIIVIRDAAIVAVASTVVGLVVNGFHPEKIPYFAGEAYQILVPCPEPGGEVTPLEATDPVIAQKDSFIVDARLKEDFAKWRFREARNLTYDYLDPTPKEAIEDLARAIASSRAKRVVVYGDGELPDTGEQLGKEIAANGIKNVFFVRGGVKALRGEPVKGDER